MSTHTISAQSNKTTSANGSPTGKLGIGDAALEFRQTHLVTSLLVSIALLVVANWLILSYRRVSLEGQKHREEMSIKRQGLYSKAPLQTSVGIQAPDEDLLCASISPYTLYKSRIPRWSFAKIRFWWGSAARLEIERLKAETEKWNTKTEKWRTEDEKWKTKTEKWRTEDEKWKTKTKKWWAETDKWRAETRAETDKWWAETDKWRAETRAETDKWRAETRAETDKWWAETDKWRAETRAETNKWRAETRAETDKWWAETDKWWAETDKWWAERKMED